LQTFVAHDDKEMAIAMITTTIRMLHCKLQHTITIVMTMTIFYVLLVDPLGQYSKALKVLQSLESNYFINIFISHAPFFFFFLWHYWNGLQTRW
jgi:hypothetical protein